MCKTRQAKTVLSNFKFWQFNQTRIQKSDVIWKVVPYNKAFLAGLDHSFYVPEPVDYKSSSKPEQNRE